MLFTSYDKFPDDFDPKVYKSLHIDINHMSISKAAEHFKVHGFKEGRTYKQGQQVRLAKYLVKALEKFNSPQKR